jgi:ApeA N-terminal domain 1
MNTETKKYEGYWWFPDNPDKKVTGSLSIDQREGIEVKTIGSLLPQQALFSNQIELLSQEILLGQTVDGSCITLIGTHCTNWDSGSDEFSSDLSKSTHTATLAIVGKRHFLSKNEIVFSSAEVRFSLLDEWLCKSGFTFKHESNSKGYPTKFNLEYEYPEVLEFSIDSIEAEFKTNYIFNRNKTNLQWQQWQLGHKSFLGITPAQPQTFDWYSKKFDSLRKFLIVMTGFPLSTGEIVGYGDESYIYSNSDIKTKEKFQVYVKLSDSFLDTVDKHPAHLLINLPSLETELSTVLNTWFQKSEILDPAVILYVATLSIDLGYSEFRLLNYAQGLEALHRRVFGGKYITDDEYDPIASVLIKSIPKEVDKDHRSSLEGRIKHGHEFSQRKRIKFLLDDVWTGCLDEFIEDKNAFVNKVVNTRNYLIHFDPISASKAVFGTEIFYVAERLKVLLITHILIQLDIPRENVYRAVKQFTPFAYLKQRKL